MNEQLIIDINNHIQKLTVGVIDPMYGIRDRSSVCLISQTLDQEVFGVKLYPTVLDKAAYLWYALSNYHCFYNGNKRTALVTTFIYLRVNGYYLNVDSTFYDISLNIVESNLEKQEIKRIIKNNILELTIDYPENIMGLLKKEISKNSSFREVLLNLSLT
ncbi:type II toxin-antitoxin system death-on-curing family toxin [uncultured Vagococcus sp.]|uniref:type II toxin-antitoxin system death-on-curing family toxin n=1 Tax=uncultured Vagococcus sp. TaxID=189676 RepID=UPI0028D3CCDB|nr:type II toxin-antitoxin system death-on-curing family toxin [uncultured Vagococcus sp.]